MSLKALYYQIKRHFIIPHLLFWGISIVLFTVALLFTRGDFNISDINLKMATNILVTILFLAISVYINLLWLIPFLFYKRKFLHFFILELANILLFIFLNFFISYFFEGGQHPNFLSEIIAEFILVLVFLIVSTLFKVMRDSITLQDVRLKMKEVEKQKIEAELKALKAQINPHFFFNTLNSLYSLSLDRSEKAPELILKLSDLMRYVIYESKDEEAPISKQIEFLKSYIYLEKLRTNENLDLRFIVKGDNFHHQVAPLLFIAFIENAFKHGVKSKEAHPFIHIFFNMENSDRIEFSIVNNKEPISVTPNPQGIGLENVKKRLELLYQGRYRLNINDSDDQYRVELTIFMK